MIPIRVLELEIDYLAQGIQLTQEQLSKKVTIKDRYCYIIYTKLRRKRIPYAHLHYISNPDLFGLAYRDIRKSILSHAKAYFLLIDSRLVKNKKLPVSICLPYRAPKQYMSATLKPEQIDNLYSELVMLNLRAHPLFKYLMRDLRRKITKKQDG